ncbi:(2Fe-2S) ferredoxin domain-containing protein [Candidatus Poribacteria bacterium]|nr:(2Fe-2S) ferredoxin domain-containing protein [Candidatus Poribacteria bacterium]
MPKLKSMEDLRRVREKALRDLMERSKVKIIVGMGTCGIAAGAKATFDALSDELAKRNIDATLTMVGCIGMCTYEPLVDIETPEGRITYGHMTADRVPRLVEEHLVKGRIIREWVIAQMRPEAIRAGQFGSRT